MNDFLALDTETTGVDHYHGSRPYLVTTCDAAGGQRWWEWDVDPLTRAPLVPPGALDEVAALTAAAPALVLQNAKFDVTALGTLRPALARDWRWGDTHDLLVLSHLLASNQPKDLTSLALRWLGVDLRPLEDALEAAVKKCRGLVQQARLRRKRGKEAGPLADWAIAEPGAAGMPSMTESGWKADGWLPRAVVLYACRTGAYGLLPPHPRQPAVGRAGDCDVRIDRGTDWGNPFRVSAALPRAEAVRRYADYVLGRPDLLARLPELYGRRLGCHCAPAACHGDVLRALCHPWLTVLRDYANGDSAATAALFPALHNEVMRRGYGAVYEAGCCKPRLAWVLESGGVTCSGERVAELEARYAADAARAAAACVGVAAHYGYELDLPRGGRNKSLDGFVFDVLKLEKVYNPKARSAGPTLDSKAAVPHYLATLPARSLARRFVRALADKRSRDTALSYLAGYRRFWLPLEGVGNEGWYRLHPSLNPTATDTLRWSSSNPNSQNISKQGMVCTDCHGDGCAACDGRGLDPRSLRYAFGPAPGREWYSLDARGIEDRLPAYRSGQAELIAIFERPEEPPYYGSNHLLRFHTVYPDVWEGELGKVCHAKCCGGRAVTPETVGPHCKKVFASTWYQWCKNGGFAVQYGAVDRPDGTGTADRAFHRPGSHARLRARFGKLERLNRHYIEQANRLGYVETFPDRSVDPLRGYPLMVTRTERGRVLETVPLNYAVQGTACWVLLRGMSRTQEYLDGLNAREPGKDYRLIMNVHDEIVLDFPYEPDRGNLPKVLEIKRLLESAGEDLSPGIPLPFGVEYHRDNWGSGETLA